MFDRYQNPLHQLADLFGKRTDLECYPVNRFFARPFPPHVRSKTVGAHGAMLSSWVYAVTFACTAPQAEQATPDRCRYVGDDRLDDLRAALARGAGRDELLSFLSRMTDDKTIELPEPSPMPKAA